MYTPKFFAEDDPKELLQLMQRYNFAVLVTAGDKLEATHLPFIVERKDDRFVLTAHMAKANPQWRLFADKEVLVIFSGPHAYISPLLYKEKQNVPTWNYVAVHAYGTVRTFETVAENLVVLEKTMAELDPEYFNGNWKELPEDYVTKLAGGIVSFEIEVTEIQGKKKLSQSKPGEDARRVIEAFENGSPDEREIGRYMAEAHAKL